MTNMPQIDTPVTYLSGKALNWAVGRCLGQDVSHENGHVNWAVLSTFAPATFAAQALPLIEAARLSVYPGTELGWWARQAGVNTVLAHGSTLLEAAMRCIVMSFVGNTMSVPEELL